MRTHPTDISSVLAAMVVGATCLASSALPRTAHAGELTQGAAPAQDSATADGGGGQAPGSAPDEGASAVHGESSSEAAASGGDAIVESDQPTRPGGEFGPFFEDAPVSEVRYPSATPRAGQPLFGVGGGAFCFVEDSGCKSSLIADFDFGVGMNVISSDYGLDVPFTQWRARGGFTVRPMYMAQDRWHRWGLGLTASYAQGSPQVVTGRDSTSDPLAVVGETPPLRSTRIDLVNQIWLSQKRNALHVDFSLGATRSTVLDAPGHFWGTHAEVGLGWSGLAGFYASTDFLDQDLRAVFGFRTHAGIAGPIIGLIALGLLAGGAV